MGGGGAMFPSHDGVEARAAAAHCYYYFVARDVASTKLALLLFACFSMAEFGFFSEVGFFSDFHFGCLFSDGYFRTGISY